MKKLLTLAALATALTLTGCSNIRNLGRNNSAYDHGVQGTVIRSSLNGTNIETADEINVDLRVRGKGPAPKIEIPTGVDPSPRQMEKRGRFANPPFPPMSQVVQPQQPQPQVPSASPCPPEPTGVSRGMNAWHSTPGTPIGASVLPPKPVANSETLVSAAWTGGSSYQYRKSKGSDVAANVMNGQLASSSISTWNNTQTDTQNPVWVPCDCGCGKLVLLRPSVGNSSYYGGYSQPYGSASNYQNTGGGYPTYYTSNLQRPQGRSSNYYPTRSSNYYHWPPLEPALSSKYVSS